MITVIAGVNGAGKSSIIGSNLRAKGASYFNPDEVTQLILKAHPEKSPDDANSFAWQLGFDQLKQAIDKDLDYTFETTLGGNSICNELRRAIELGVQVTILYCGLNSPELHIKRVAARVAKGGHDIPEAKIRTRWANSMANLESLIPSCAEVAVFDNSAELVDGKPTPTKLFAMHGDRFVAEPNSKDFPDWALPLATAAIKRSLKK